MTTKPPIPDENIYSFRDALTVARRCARSDAERSTIARTLAIITQLVVERDEARAEVGQVRARLAAVAADRDMLRDVVGLYLSKSAPVPNEDGGRPGWVAAYVEMREFGRTTEIYQGVMTRGPGEGQ